MQETSAMTLGLKLRAGLCRMVDDPPQGHARNLCSSKATLQRNGGEASGIHLLSLL